MGACRLGASAAEKPRPNGPGVRLGSFNHGPNPDPSQVIPPSADGVHSLAAEPQAAFLFHHGKQNLAKLSLERPRKLKTKIGRIQIERWSNAGQSRGLKSATC
jgi:hypothetical protein